MANEIKITKKMYLTAMANYLKSLDEDVVLENGITPTMAVKYCEKEVENLNKKNTSKSTSKATLEKRAKDEVLQNAIYNAMAQDTPYNCATIRNICPEVSDYATISASKLSYLLTDMINKGKITRKEIKRVPHYTKVVAEAED